MRIQLAHTIGPSGGAVSCDLINEVLILDLSSGVYFGLEGVGSVLWQYIQEPRTVQQVVDHLMSQYDVSRETCETQTVGFLEDLAKHGLIAVEKDAAA
jgi:Coenzyme PQQ synthesis protein D (PqqD)